MCWRNTSPTYAHRAFKWPSLRLSRGIAALAIAFTLASAVVRAEHLVSSIPLTSSADGGTIIYATLQQGGETYVAGGFGGVVDFNPNGASNFVTAPMPCNTSRCPFIAKYDANFTLEWVDVFVAGRIGDSSGVITNSNGGVYVEISFETSLAYLPGTTSPVLTTPGMGLAILALSSDGAVTGEEQLGSFYALASSFQESSPSIVDVGWTEFPASGGTTAYVSRLNLDLQTVTNLVVISSSSGFVGYGQSASDGQGGKFVIGGWTGTVDFDALGAHHVLTTNDSEDGFVARYDASGHLVWLRSISSPSSAMSDLAVDSSGNVWSVGVVSGTVVVETSGTPTTITANGTTDTMILGYDGAGSLMRIGHFGASGASASASALCISGDSSLVVSGSFSGSIPFGLEPGSTRVSSVGIADIFLLVADTSLSQKYFGHLGSANAYSYPLDLRAGAAWTSLSLSAYVSGVDISFNYALPPENATLTSPGSESGFFAVYDLNPVFKGGFE